jgi:hypothetical protein
MRVLPLFIAVALSASLAACSGGPATSGDGNAGGNGDGTSSDGGGGGEDTGGTGLPDPCALVTRAEVETAAGGPMVGDGEELDPGPTHYAFGLGRQCVWGPVNGVVSPTFVTVYTYSADAWARYKTDQAGYSSYHDISGVGDEALSAGTGAIGVHEGDIVLDIQVGYEVAQDPAGEPRVITLATTALGNV